MVLPEQRCSTSWKQQRLPNTSWDGSSRMPCLAVGGSKAWRLGVCATCPLLKGHSRSLRALSPTWKDWSLDHSTTGHILFLAHTRVRFADAHREQVEPVIATTGCEPGRTSTRRPRREITEASLCRGASWPMKRLTLVLKQV
eukprot:4283908-Amphidinium_carterae.2